ncbi:MAG: hypothetical protein LBM73_00475 [Candidatus Nomurabacteria bacterium]|jgi:hypothetical protein|nr:hypothetical protein [Candidatus Nomurabacteria bacterium]
MKLKFKSRLTAWGGAALLAAGAIVSLASPLVPKANAAGETLRLRPSSTNIAVNRQDNIVASIDPTLTMTNGQLTLSSTGSGYSFYSGTSTGGCGSTTPLSNYTISTNSAKNKGFCFAASTAGSYTITAEWKADDGIDATQTTEITVTDGTSSTSVSSEADLTAAVNDPDVETIMIDNAAGITLTNNFDGNGKTIIVPAGSYGLTLDSYGGTPDNITISNVIIEGQDGAKALINICGDSMEPYTPMNSVTLQNVTTKRDGSHWFAHINVKEVKTLKLDNYSATGGQVVIDAGLTASSAPDTNKTITTINSDSATSTAGLLAIGDGGQHILSFVGDFSQSEVTKVETLYHKNTDDDVLARVTFANPVKSVTTQRGSWEAINPSSDGSSTIWQLKRQTPIYHLNDSYTLLTYVDDYGVTQQYNIATSLDMTMPTAVASSTRSDRPGSIRQKVIVTVDGDGYTVTSPDRSWTPVAGTTNQFYSWVWENGKHTISYTVKDQIGRYITQSYTADFTAPVINLTDNSGNVVSDGQYINAANGGLNAYIADAGNNYAWLSDNDSAEGAFGSCQNGMQYCGLSWLSEGAHTLTAYDSEGNTGTISFTIDNTDPDVIQIIGYNATTNTITIKASDELSGVANVEVYDGTTDLGAATFDQATGNWTLSTLAIFPLGSVHYLTAIATDRAGNSTSSAAYSFAMATLLTPAQKIVKPTHPTLPLTPANAKPATTTLKAPETGAQNAQSSNSFIAILASVLAALTFGTAAASRKFARR